MTGEKPEYDARERQSPDWRLLQTANREIGVRSARGCSVGLQADTVDSHTCPPEGGRYNRQFNFRSTTTLRPRRLTDHQSLITSHQSPIFPQHRNEMQPPSKQRAERKRIDGDAVIPALNRQT